MQRHSSIKVFSRFNRTIFAVFVLVIFIAFALSITRYYRESSAYEQQAKESMEQIAATLNLKLSHSVQALNGLLEFADYFLTNPEQAEQLQPNLIQEADTFYLQPPPRDVIRQRKQLRGNITGIGDIKQFDLLQKQELAMANALTPAFITAQHTNPEVIWFYYVSKKRFVSLFPWVSKNIWKYRDQLISRPYFTNIQNNMKKGNLFWSPPYSDSAGKGLIASLAVGVQQQQKFSGVLVLDIALAKFAQSLPDITQANHGYMLLDKNYNVLINKGNDELSLTKNTDWHDIAPQAFATISNRQLDNLSATQVIGNWFIQKQVLPVNQWMLIKYQPYHQFISPVVSEFLFWFLILLSGLVAFIVLIYWLTRKTFIKPAVEFIQHIENCAQGDSGKIKPTADWRHWFHVVEDIFSQNRSLMQQLKDKNVDLDLLVKEKTFDLQKTSEQHQRDYALLRSVMNAMQELIIFSDGEGKLIGCNLALEKFVNQKQADILGKKACELLPANLCNALIAQAKQAYTAKTTKAYQQVVKMDEDIYELFSRKFFNEAGDALGTINIFRDVTQAYAIQSDLESAKNQAERANKIKGQFLANMSHEIRTPINAIQGMMSLMAKTTLNRVQKQYLANAETASVSLLYLIEELLDLAKIEAGKMPIVRSYVLLDDIIDKALKLNIAKANAKQLPITISIALNVPQYIYSDEIRLVQVLTNFINNAVKFTDQGEVKLELEKLIIDNKEYLRCAVIDSGIGIAKDKQSSLFNAFTQADESMTRKYGGTGLGLSICRQIIQLLQGNLTLESELGKGSTFSFTIPLTTQQQPQKESASKVAESQCSLISVQDILPVSLINKLESLSWQYRHYDQLEPLLSLECAADEVLLITPESINNDRDLFSQVCDKFNVIALCTPMLSEIDEQLSDYLDSLEVTWSIVEKPYYRALMSKIVSLLAKRDSELLTCDNKNISSNNSVIDNTSHQVTTDIDQTDNHTNERNLSGIDILLVEDNLVNQMVATELLKSMQATVTLANNGAEALNKLAEQQFDIVLMDIQMPIMDGLTAAREIRQQAQYKTLPIIAMTAHAGEEDRQQSIAAGMNLHIAKPITADNLLASIVSLLD